MAAIALDLLNEVVDRMTAAAVIANADRIRLNHRTEITREDAPAVYVRPDEDPLGKDHGGCNVDHALAFVISVFVRADDDDIYGPFYAIAQAILAVLNPANSPCYRHNATLKLRRIAFADGVADGDALRGDLSFEFGYVSATWSLE